MQSKKQLPMDLNGDVIKFLLVIPSCDGVRLEMSKITYILLSKMLGGSRYQDLIITC